MTANLFPSPPWPALPVQGEAGHYPIHRIFCVGKNYAAHAAEMGGEVNREQPIFFTKSALAFLPPLPSAHSFSSSLRSALP